MSRISSEWAIQLVWVSLTRRRMTAQAVGEQDDVSREECCCLMATESIGRLLARLGVPSIVRGIVLDIGAKVVAGHSPPRLRIAETALGRGKRMCQRVGPE